MAGDPKMVGAVLWRAALGFSPLVGMVALQLWLVDAPVTNGGTFGDGLLHGVITPMNALRWVVGASRVKDFASGWGYELGWLVGFIGMLSVWQTLLQVSANRLAGRVSPFDRPVSFFALGLFVSLLLCGGVFGSGPTPELGAIPPLWNVVPGTVRHGMMALAGLVMAGSGALAGVGLLLRR